MDEFTGAPRELIGDDSAAFDFWSQDPVKWVKFTAATAGEGAGEDWAK